MFFRSSGFGSSFAIGFAPFSFNFRLLKDRVNVDFNYTVIAVHSGCIETGIVTDGVIPGLEVRLDEIPDVLDHLPGIVGKLSCTCLDVIPGEVDPCLDQLRIDPCPEFTRLLSQDLPRPVRSVPGEDSVPGSPFGWCSRQFLGFLPGHLVIIAQGIVIRFLRGFAFAIGG
jgi:hypothetical protein